MKTYKDLLIWQKAIKLVILVYQCLDDFPKEELYGLQSQIKRTVVSIPSNIAEGWGRNSKQSYIQFLRISKGSLFELETQLIIAKELNYLDEVKYRNITELITEESKMLNAYIKSISK